MNKEHYIKFDEEHVGKIIDGKKTQTIRMGDPYLWEGQVVELQTPRGVTFGKAIVEDIEEVEADEIPYIDFEGHRNYDNFETFAVQMYEYYEEHVEPETEFHIITFKILNTKGRERHL